jgi:hypothetical protein
MTLHLHSITRHVPPEASNLARRIESSRHVIVVEVDANGNAWEMVQPSYERDLIVRALRGET